MVVCYHSYGNIMLSFKSQTIQKILSYYFINSHAKHYVNELARLLELDPKNTHKKLTELEEEGILKSEFQGNQRYFFLSSSPLVKTYKQLLSQTFGLEMQLKKALSKVEGVKESYIYGSYAKGLMSAGSDIDLLVVGGQSAVVLQKAVNLIQKNSGRELNIVNMSEKEFESKKNGKNPFIVNVLKGKTIKII